MRVVVTCHRCEREWSGPADGACPHCGAEGGIEDHAVREVSDTRRMPSNPKESKWYVTPKEARKRKPIGITLSDEARDRLDRMSTARKVSRSQVIEDMIMNTHIRG